MTALLLCAVLSAFYLRAEGDRTVSALSVERVFLHAAVTAAPVSERQRRDDQRSAEMAALSALADREPQGAETLQALVERAENELAIENALAAMGQGNALCSLRREAASVCVKNTLNAAQAQAVIELCAQMAGIVPEKVFILDGCAYL